MGLRLLKSRGFSAALFASATVGLMGCSPAEDAPAPAAPPVDAAEVPPEDPAAAPAAQPLAESDQTWTPEQLEALLAPVALYPEPVLSQLLLAATNPQEVLDAGNWLVANPELEGAALEDAAKAAGFTPPVRAVMQFRAIVDQMCLEMGWTTELGQAFVNDQAGVLAAVQRLRKQAQDVGNLKSSPQMKVETKVENGKEAIVIEPPSPEVIYVPTYDPEMVYAPPAPATTTTNNTTVIVQEDSGPSTGAVVATGFLSFGVGLAVGSTFNNNYYGRGRYYPNYYGGFIPPPPPYYYRPTYGGGYYPSHNYDRSRNYNKVLSDNNVVVVNNNNKNKNYWNSFNDRPTGGRNTNDIKSPITTARPDRPELATLNAQAKQPKQAAANKAADWKGQSSYAGARPDVRDQAKLPAGAKMPDSKEVAAKARANAAAAPQRPASAAGDRGYAGYEGGAKDRVAANPDAAAKAKQAAAARPEAAAKTKQAAAARPEAAAKTKQAAAARPDAAAKAKKAAAARPDAAAKAKKATTSRPKASSAAASRGKFSGSGSGASARASSQRGRSSMPKGAKSHGAAAAKGRKR